MDATTLLTNTGDVTTRTREFQRGNQSLNTYSARGEQGGVIGVETGSGQTGAIGRTAEGDIYAAKDGQAYKHGDDEWYQQDEGSWNKVEVPDERAAQIDQKKSAAADRYGNRSDRSNASFDTGRYQGSFDTNRHKELNQSQRARTNGYQSYNARSSFSRSSTSRRFQGGRRGGGRRR